jgi:hypothetical protein
MIRDIPGRNMDIHGRYIGEDGNVITGACFYNGIITMQHRKVFEVFESFLSKVRPARIIEIGTSHGGLTLFLRHTLNGLGLNDSLIRTFDINQFTSNEILKKEKNLELIHDNIFSDDYLTLINSSYITDFLSDDGPNIILCDGGNKINEFNLLSEFLKPNDFILAHDYCSNLEVFKDKILNKIWCWLEIQDDDILNSCEKYSLEPHMEETFSNIVWVCKQKK